MPNITFPSSAITPDAFGPAELGYVYIGTVNTDPTVLANRIDVTITQQNGTPVTIHPAAQPFTLDASGMLNYGGSVVLASTSVPYAMTVQDSTGALLYYIPNSTVGSSTSTSSLILASTGSDPSPVASSGILYCKTVAGVVELFYEDAGGQVIQLTNDGALNVDLGTSTVSAQIINAIEQVTGTQFRGAPITLAIVAGNVTCDMSVGQNYFLTLDQNVTNFYLSNIPTSKIPNICIDILNTGSFTITNFVPVDGTYTIFVPSNVTIIEPGASARTSYGLSVMPNKVINIFPVLMRQYYP